MGPPVRQVAELETSTEEVGTRSCRNLGALTQSLGFILWGWEPMEDILPASVVISAVSLSTHCAVWTASTFMGCGTKGRESPTFQAARGRNGHIFQLKVPSRPPYWQADLEQQGAVPRAKALGGLQILPLCAHPSSGARILSQTPPWAPLNVAITGSHTTHTPSCSLLCLCTFCLFIISLS